MMWFLLFVSLGALLVAIPLGLIALWIWVARLTRRLAVLEARLETAAGAESRTSAPPAVVQVSPRAPTPPPPPPAAEPVAAPVAPRPVTPRPVPPRVNAPTPDRPAPRPAQPEEWEVVVGTNWLNKIGVLVFVLGVAFLIAYSFAHVGPAGRIALGYAIGAALLGSGVTLQRRAAYRTYAYGLVAGGWAAVYFTTFAMHGVPAARIIQSEVAGVLALVAVAGAMIAHSLVYRSQTVTALAYVVAYGTLAITPLSGFSAAASVPLTASLLAVSARLRWPGMTVVGLVSTYLLFAIREQVFRDSAFDPADLTRYFALGTYWILFEAADIAARRASRPPRPAGAAPMPATSAASAVPLMALNAMGLLGTMLLQVPAGNTALASWVMGGAAVAYLSSALVRAALIPVPSERVGDEPAGPGFTSTHAAIAVSAALFAWTVGLRFTGPRETIAFLLEAQLIVAAGVALGDPVLRRIGAWTAILASLSAGLLALTHTSAAVLVPTMTEATPVVLLVAGVWYANDTWLRRRGILTGVERSYTWIALGLAGLVIAIELAPAHQGPAVLVLSALLLERALRDARDYRAQAFVAAALGGAATLQHFALEPVGPNPADVRLALPLAAVVCYGFAWRVAGAGAARAWQVNHLQAGTLMSWAGTGFVAVLLWREMPDAAVGLAWMSVALVCAITGVWRQAPSLRWQGYILAGTAGVYAALPLLAAAVPADRAGFAAATAAVACVMVVLARRGLAAPDASSTTQETRALSAIVAIGVTIVLLVARAVLPAASVAAAWAAVGVAMHAGPWRAAPESRWLAAAALGAGAWRTLAAIAQAGAGDMAHVAWSLVVIAVLYGAAFVAGSPKPTSEPRGRVDAAGHGVLIVSATLLLALLTLDELRTGLVTPVWGIEGLALLLAGFFRRDRLVRLAGLAVLLACLLKLFGYDLRTLEPLARIISFVVLGLVLLAVSWGYTKHRETVGRLFKESAGPQDPG